MESNYIFFQEEKKQVERKGLLQTFATAIGGADFNGKWLKNINGPIEQA